MTITGSWTKNDVNDRVNFSLLLVLDRLHGMNDVIGQKPATATSSVPDFNAVDEDR